ncbi:MAG: hypothetical protein O7G85_01890 [Planctomycetota bacterium]|nr:hypothetical protein [Planctomycetota bacterium]
MERVEKALSIDGGFQGTIILISHDRALLEAVCDKLLVFDGEGGVQLFQGGLQSWLDKQKAKAAPTESSDKPSTKPVEKKKPTPKKADKAASPLGNLSLSKIEAKIETIERRINEIDTLMVDPDVYTDGPRVKVLQQERSELHEKLTPLEFEWAVRAEDS